MKKVDLRDIIINDVQKNSRTTDKRILIVGSVFILSILLIVAIIKYFPSTTTNTTPELQTVLSTEVIAPNYYIQVSMFKKERALDKYFLKKIKRTGFKLVIEEDDKFKKVLIGPFNGYTQANDNLEAVRNKIQKDAFIVKE